MKINSSCSLVFAPFSTCKLRLQFPELPAAPDWERHAARPLRNVVSKVVYIYRDSTSEEHSVTINSDCGPAHKLQPERRRRKGKSHLRHASGTTGLSESVRTDRRGNIPATGYCCCSGIKDDTNQEHDQAWRSTLD